MIIEQYGKIFGKIFSSLEEGVHAVDAEGNSILYNRAMANMEKMSVQEVLDKPFGEAFSNLSKEESTLMQALEHGTVIMGKFQKYINSHGEEVTTVNDTMPVVYQGNIIAAVEIARKVTDLADTFYDYEKMSLEEHLHDRERALIKTALKFNRGNISKTAECLKLKRSTLRYKMDKYNLQVEQ